MPDNEQVGDCVSVCIVVPSTSSNTLAQVRSSGVGDLCGFLKNHLEFSVMCIWWYKCCVMYCIRVCYKETVLGNLILFQECIKLDVFGEAWR